MFNPGNYSGYFLAIEIASGGLAAKRSPAWARLSTQVDGQL